jgi:hypothetical protein
VLLDVSAPHARGSAATPFKRRYRITMKLDFRPRIDTSVTIGPSKIDFISHHHHEH